MTLAAREDRRRIIDLTLRLTQRSVTSEFKGTALGRLWSFINPLATIAVYALIFGVVFRGGVAPGRHSGITSFAIWIGIGVLCWSFMSSAIINGMNALTSNAGLLTKVYFPRQVLVYSAVLALVVDFAFEIGVLVVILLIVGGPGVLAMVPMVLVVTVLAAMFSTGVGLVLSVATVYYRDIAHVWQIFNQVWMYASGVVFPLSMLDQVQNDLFDQGYQINGEPLPITLLFRLNPAQTYLEAFRACLYDYAVPSVGVMTACAVWGVGVLAVGTLVFRRYSTRIVEEL